MFHNLELQQMSHPLEILPLASTHQIIRCQSAVSWPSPPNVQYSPSSQKPVSCVLVQHTRVQYSPVIRCQSAWSWSSPPDVRYSPRYQMPISFVLVQPSRCPVQPPLSDANQLCLGPALQMSSTAPVIRCQSALSWSSPPDVQYSPVIRCQSAWSWSRPPDAQYSPRYQMTISFVLVQPTRCPVQPLLSDDNQLCPAPAHQMSSTALAIR